MSGEAWLVAALALALCLALTPVLRAWLLARGVMDAPGERRSHVQETARGGGLAILAAMLAALMLASGGRGEVLPLLGFAAVLGALGWLDDRHDLSVGARLAGMLLCALAFLLHTGPVGEVRVLNHVLAWPWLWSGLAVVAVVWVINLHNFMDGSDGLAAMQGTWTTAALGYLLYTQGLALPGLAGLGLAGACLGFLYWNRPPASIFMGDAGSVLLGGMIALLALIGAVTSVVSVWVSLIIYSVFVVDASATLIRRVAAGARWYNPHREHAYQRLIIAGWSHGRVLALYAGLNLLLVLPVLVMALREPRWDWLMAVLLCGLLLAGWFAVQRHTRKGESQEG